MVARAMSNAGLRESLLLRAIIFEIICRFVEITN